MREEDDTSSRSESVSSQWQVGDLPESLQKHTGVAFLTDLRDPRLALYWQRRQQDPWECKRQESALARQAMGTSPAPSVSRDPEELGVLIGLHSSWECLQQLHKAQAAGRSVLVHSVLVSSLARDDLLETAAEVTPEVYAVEPQLIPTHFQSRLAGLPALACSFVVACPVSKPLARLRPPLVVLDGLESPQSIGQILRTAAHLGVSSVVATPTSWSSLNGPAARSSMGALYNMDFHLATSLEDALRELQGLGVRAYVAESHSHGPVQPHQPAGDKRWALILGSEDSGVSAASRRLSDARVCVPQRGGGSLSVAGAAAICLYELGRHVEM